MDLTGRTVVVTGATGGIGGAVVRALAAQGARVAAVGRDPDRLRAALERCGAQGACAAADLTDRQAVHRAVAQLAEQLGPPHALVAAAGIGAFGPFPGTDPGLGLRLMAVNFHGTVHAVEAVLPHLRRRGEGSLVLVGSVAGRTAAPLESWYSASKFALTGLAEALAAELAEAGIRVSLVQPGPVATDFFRRRGHAFPLAWPRPVAPEAVARAVVGCLLRGTPEVFVPPSLGLALRLGALMPGLRRWGLRRLARRLTAG